MSRLMSSASKTHPGQPTCPTLVSSCNVWEPPIGPPCLMSLIAAKLSCTLVPGTSSWDEHMQAGIALPCRECELLLVAQVHPSSPPLQRQGPLPLPELHTHLRPRQRQAHPPMPLLTPRRPPAMRQPSRPLMPLPQGLGMLAFPQPVVVPSRQGPSGRISINMHREDSLILPAPDSSPCPGRVQGHLGSPRAGSVALTDGVLAGY